MKRLGFRAASVSTEEKVDAKTECSQTTEPQLFYIVCCVFVLCYLGFVQNKSGLFAL
jgi:hypothetical protein